MRLLCQCDSWMLLLSMSSRFIYVLESNAGPSQTELTEACSVFLSWTTKLFFRLRALSASSLATTRGVPSRRIRGENRFEQSCWSSCKRNGINWPSDLCNGAGHEVARVLSMRGQLIPFRLRLYIDSTESVQGNGACLPTMIRTEKEEQLLQWAYLSFILRDHNRTETDRLIPKIVRSER